MRQWCITVTWRSESGKTVEAASDGVVADGTELLDTLERMVEVLPMLSEAGKAHLTQRQDYPVSRETQIMVANGERRRSVSVVQQRPASEEEADRCTHQIMDWLFSEETTELLTA
jgi:hypothetical protein